MKVALEDVSILTRPEGRVQPAAGRYSYGHPESFNPHPSRRTGATYCSNDTDTVAQVSILTRPEGRVQHCPPLPEPGTPLVSILTRPEGRVQPLSRMRWA